jgi:hypothetical protein
MLASQMPQRVQHPPIWAQRGQDKVTLSRRAMLVGGAAVMGGAVVGTQSTGCAVIPLIVEAIAMGIAALASSGVAELAMVGVEIGTLAYQAYTQATKDKPASVDAQYKAVAKQGQGQVYDFPNLPVQGNGKAVSTLSADGAGYVVTSNPVEEAIRQITITDDQGNQSHQNGNNESFLNYLPNAWLPGAGLYLLGLNQANYVHLDCVTDSGKSVSIELVPG